MKNRKSAYLHQIVNQLLDENQIIAIENLNVSGMLKNHKLAKAIQELSFSEFVRILKYKAEWYGRTVVEIGRFFPSSQLCSECGCRHAGLTLKDREWVCEDCGCVHDRDLNASYNILNEGLRLLREKIPGSTGESTPVEIVLVDDIVGVKPSYALKSTQSMNQESMAFASCFQ
jgi:putative transposase